MAVIKTYDLARMTTSTVGTGTMNLDGAATVNGVLYLTFAQAGVSTGEVVIYTINDATGGNSEVGYGTYTTGSPPTLSRTVLHSTNSNNAINLSGSATVALCALAENLMLGSMIPQGRLTLVTGTPVMTSTQSAKTTVYYTPYTGNLIPIYNGAFFVNMPFTETSQALSDTTKSPAAAGTFGSASNVPACYDMFGWDDSGTIRVTRGPGFTTSTSGSAIVSVASPAVVTWNAHGLTEGAPVFFTGAGLPTGITANTVYYVSRSPGTNSFSVSTTLANATVNPVVSVNTTGTSTGTQTCENHTAVRGTGSGTSELEYVNGILVNKNAITSGPGAQKGTYLGTIYTNASSQVEFIIPSTPAAGGTAGVIGLWNAYNRVWWATSSQDSNNSWTWWTGLVLGWRASDASLNMRTSFVCGLAEDIVEASFAAWGITSSGSPGRHAIGYDSTTAKAGVSGNATVSSSNIAAFPFHSRVPEIGFHFLTALEYSAANATYYGNSGSATEIQNGLEVRGRY